QGETLDVAPTVGYSEATTKFGNYDLRIMDVGGGRSIRGVWKHYMAEAHGVIFVVDASDEERMEEGREELALVLQHPFIAGKPILLLANKQDVDGAMNEASVCDALQLEDVVNRNRCPCKVELCAAVTSKPKKMDPPLQRGLMWLVTNIAGQFDPLTARMKSDMEVQEEERKEEALKRKERIRLKHEREKREEEERNKEEVENRQVDAEKQNDESSNTQTKSPFHENESTIA
uniref:ADP-ribosylation factor-like protein 13B n=1 Tax=Ciona savignyi TaxID=51511 RepID=H2ZKP5_CIOSA